MKTKTVVRSLLLIMITMLVGCGTSNEVGEVTLENKEITEETSKETTSQERVIDENTPMGRYTETDITPAEINNVDIVHFSKNDTGQFLLSVFDKDKKEPRGFVYEDNSWIEQDNSKVIEFLKKESPKEIKVTSDFTGNWWVFIKEEDIFSKCIKIGNDGKIIEIDGINEAWINQVIVSNQIMYLGCTTNGNGNSYIMDIETAEIVKNNIGNYYESVFHIEGNSMFKAGEVDRYSKYDITTGEVIEHYDLPRYADNFSWTPIDVKGESFIFLNHDGIHKIEKGGTIIQTIISDASFAFDDPNRTGYPSYIKADLEKDDYILVDTFNHSELKVLLYKYDETVPTKKSESLSIWALENDMLRDQVAVFSQQNPDVHVEFVSEEMDPMFVAKDIEEVNEMKNIFYDEMIKKLNAKLLAGDTPDIICLDGLPIEALKDNDMLIKLELDIDETQYYEKILNSYSDEKGVYAYPTKFYTYLFASDGSIDLDKENNMKDIAKLYQDPKTMEYASVFPIYFYPNYHEIFPDYTTVDEIALKDFLEQTKAMEESMKENGLERYNGFRFGKSDNAVNVVSSFSDAGYLFLSHENVELTSLLDGTYIGKNILSIPSDAKNKEMAEKFILSSLSDESASPMNRYFSVKKDVDIEKLKKIITSEDISGIDTESSENNKINIKKNADMYAVDWESLFDGLEYGCGEDYILYNIVKEGAIAFYESQSMSADDAVANIMNKLDILFAERR